jgi:G:T/U-mismatch repair DNA glycosylase
MSDEFSIEHHPEWDYPVRGMHVLILGNFPPHSKRWDYKFFYPNKQNNFWKVLSILNGTPLKEMKGDAAVQERQKIMRDLKVGIYNLARSIKRKNKSARDTDIEILEYLDIVSIIRKNTRLKKIILAGFAAKSSTARTFLNQLDEQHIHYSKPVEIKAGTEFQLYMGKRSIDCVILNSTSTAFPIKLEKLVEQFRPHILLKNQRF